MTGSRTVYVNGRFLPEEQASLSVFDRGLLFADAVYEVTTVLDAGLVDFKGHMRRLGRSLAELGITPPCPDEALLDVHRELVRLNGLREGIVYIQITRGSAERDFIYSDDAVPSVVAFTQSKALVDSPLAARGARIVTLPDLRWRRRDIKTTQLLYASLVKSEAARRGADDAWLVEAGYVTEGTSSNAYIVTADGTVVTRPVSQDILQGITRSAVIDYAREAGVDVDERAFSVAEAYDAKEAFLTSASSLVTPVVAIDGHSIGEGIPGDATRRIRECYLAESRRRAVR